MHRRNAASDTKSVVLANSAAAGRQVGEPSVVITLSGRAQFVAFIVSSTAHLLGAVRALGQHQGQPDFS